MSSNNKMTLDESNGIVALCDDAGRDEDDIEMLRSDVLCLVWCGTAGQGGHLLGTDEENIVFLKYIVYQVSKQQTICQHQFVVRPPPPQSNNLNNSNNNSGSSSGPADDHDISSAPITISEMTRRDYNLSEDIIRNAGEPLEAVLQKMEETLNHVTHCLDNNMPFTSTNNHHHHHHNNNNNNHSNNDKALAIIGNNSSIPHRRSFNKPIIITDGQLHMRQVLHPKAAFHNVNLPETYNIFFDLRKEFRNLYNCDEICSLQDMATFLDITMDDRDDLATRGTRTMIKIIDRMLRDSHTFQGPEQVLVKLIPAVVSKGEEVDNGCVVRARGLPWMSTDTQIASFFMGLNVAKGGVALCLSPQGRRNGEALIRFLSSEHRDMALKRHKHHMGGRYIEVYKATGEDFISVAGGNNNEANQFLSRGSIIVRMRGLPYDCTAKQVVEFFKNGENGVQLLESEDGVLFVRKPDGRATGDAFVLLSSEEDVTKALLKHRELIGSRYIELFRSTSAEVMNRSMDIRHMEQPTQQMPPLISQLPSIQPMLPQQSVAHGPKKDCIRLRGLPFEAHIENVLSFLGEYSQHIMYRGVHMVYTPQGQPSGEAFIQMTSESAAWNCTQNRHKRYMTSVNVGKPRYIDVFQCSGDDMNLVLSGGALPVVPSVAATTPTRPIVHSPSGMFVWDNGAPTGAPPLLLPSQPQSPHIQSPALHHHHHTSLPPPIHHPPPPAGFLPQGHPAAAAAAAAAAAMAGGVRPPFPPGLGLAPQALLAPPSNGIMLPTIHPSLKQQPQVLLPPPMSSTSRQPIEVSMSQVSHGMQMQPIKTTAVSSPAGYPMFTYQTPSTSTALTAASSAGMYLIPNHNPKLAAPLTSIPHHMLFPPFTQTHTPSVTSTPNPEPSSTNKPPPVHLLPTPYGSAIPNQRRVPQAAPQTQSVTSKRSYDQAFPGDRSGQGSSSGSSGGGSSKRMAAAAPSTSHFSSSTPISHPAPLPFSQAAHYPPPHPSQFAALANQPPLAHAFNPHLAPAAAAAAAAAANPMTGHLLHPLYPPPMYPQM